MEFNTIAISDGETMGTEGMRASLVSREVIADSIELVCRGQLFDAVVCIVGCDKTIPAAAMALARLDLPGLVLYGGHHRAGKFSRQKCHHSGCLRGHRRERCWQIKRLRSAGTGKCRVSRGRRLWRPVHRQHHVDGDGNDRPLSYGLQQRARNRSAQR